jgi:hypothetical protein
MLAYHVWYDACCHEYWTELRLQDKVVCRGILCKELLKQWGRKWKVVFHPQDHLV